MAEAARQQCFVDMPFGIKDDPKTGIRINFDQIYQAGIRPAIEAKDLVPIRGDQEQSGGIIHKAMFARLLMSEFCIADMTSANPNVFYELGVRHAAKPYTTIPIFATIGAPPFDVNMVRAIPYELQDGKLSPESAAALIDAIGKRIDFALSGPIAQDSPLFQLFPEFPGIEMSHELTDVFRDRVEYAEDFRTRLATAREQPEADALDALKAIAAELGDPSNIETGILMDLYLSYRAVGAHDEMIALYEGMPANTRAAAMSRQQLAFALNRRNGPGDRDRAIRVLEDLLNEHGESAETLGLLGRIYKDQYREASGLKARGMLRRAIDAYTRGFEAEPMDFYPGVNAINLLLQQGDEAALAEVERLSPLVTFAAVRRGGETASDYWTVATLMELAAAMRDYALSLRCAENALALASEAWMLETTSGNLQLIADLRKDEAGICDLHEIIAALKEAADGLRGGS